MVSVVDMACMLLNNGYPVKIINAASKNLYVMRLNTLQACL